MILAFYCLSSWFSKDVRSGKQVIGFQFSAWIFVARYLILSTVARRVYKSCKATGEIRKDYPCSAVCGGKCSCLCARSRCSRILLSGSLTSPVRLRDLQKQVHQSKIINKCKHIYINTENNTLIRFYAEFCLLIKYFWPERASYQRRFLSGLRA